MIEQEKLKLGHSTNFQVVQFQNELSEAHYSELGIRIDYLNALVQLDKTLGTTLQTYKIEFQTQREEEEKEINDKRKSYARRK